MAKIWPLTGVSLLAASCGVTAGRVHDTEPSAALPTPVPTSGAPAGVSAPVPSSTPGQTGSTQPSPTSTEASTPTPLPEYGGTSRCAQANTVICDGFEAQSPGDQPDSGLWHVVTNPGNTIEVSNTRAARGSQSLHIHSPVTGSIGATIRTSRGFPAPSNTIYGRLFLYLDAAQAPGGHNTVVRASGAASNGSNLIQFGAMFHNYVANWGGPGADNGGYSQTAFPVKKWVCLEWAHKGDEAELNVWADGASIFVMTNNWVQGNQRLQGPKIAYNELDIGWEVYEHFDDDLNSGTYEVYIDEIAVDYQRIGCGN